MPAAHSPCRPVIQPVSFSRPVAIDAIFSGLVRTLTSGRFASMLLTRFVIPAAFWLSCARRAPATSAKAAPRSKPEPVVANRTMATARQLPLEDMIGYKNVPVAPRHGENRADVIAWSGRTD